jgi:small-conductance mechanosensitive channel
VPATSLHALSSYMNSIVYIVGAVVIVLAVLSFFGFR